MLLRFPSATSLISVASRKGSPKPPSDLKNDLAPVSLSRSQTLVKSLTPEGTGPRWHERTPRQDVSEQEFLRLHPLSPAVLRVHKRYTATVVAWRPTRVIADDTRIYGRRNRSMIHPPPLQRANDELGQWSRNWRIEVNPTNQQPYNSSMVLRTPTISKYEGRIEAILRHRGITSQCAPSRGGDYPPPPPYLIRMPRNVLTNPLTLLQRQLKALMTSTTRGLT
ncbi:hypothetical protein EVAR_79262_1 [Eumeta japonica]|uniref:Uncharacterized protein n=1 Tax=Eumeta variegata TaxID=151549 RepID=A0A4C1TFN8_EUMVA|nr:hypothetical protein EVAR_79262_1 [Eumeta japonica]